MAVYATGHRDIGFDLAVEHRDPAQRQTHFVGAAQDQIWHYFQCFQVNIRLIETVEEDQRIGAGCAEAGRHIGKGAKVRTNLHRHRNRNTRLDIAYNIQIGLFHRRTIQCRIDGDIINIEFQPIGAGLLHQFGIFDPTAGRDAI